MKRKFIQIEAIAVPSTTPGAEEGYRLFALTNDGIVFTFGLDTWHYMGEVDNSYLRPLDEEDE